MNIFKKIICLAVCAAAAGSAASFAQTLPFTDVYESDWYYGDVLYSYERGLISGTDESSFSPDKLLTYGEAAKLAACMHFSERYGGTIEVYDGGGAWYDPYVMYCGAGDEGRIHVDIRRRHARRQTAGDKRHPGRSDTRY